MVKVVFDHKVNKCKQFMIPLVALAFTHIGYDYLLKSMSVTGRFQTILRFFISIIQTFKCATPPSYAFH